MTEKLLELKNGFKPPANPVRVAVLDHLKSECQKRSLDQHLVEAIIAVESSWNPWAVRYEPNFRWIEEPTRYYKFSGYTLDTEIHLQKMSFGLMQLIGGSARWLGFTGPLSKLLDTNLNITWGCALLEKKCRRYQKLETQIAAYNAGTPVMLPEGTFKNQDYVNKVLAVYQRYK